MRRYIAILLLSLHFASLTACFMVHAIAVYRSDHFFEKQIANGHYYKDDLTEIKIPVNMPGITDWSGYEHIYGEVRFANTAYNYVNIKMTRNAIYLQCIPNYKTTKLCGQNIIDASKLPDVPVNKKDHVPFDKVFNLPVFIVDNNYYSFVSHVRQLDMRSASGNIAIISASIANPGQPPQIG